MSTLKRWGFDSVLSFEQFWYADHSFLGKQTEPSDYLMAAIGQANAKITPFGLNLCTNALISGTGSIVEPRRIMAKTNVQGAMWEQIELGKTHRMCEKDVAETVRDMMIQVVKSGTGKTFYMKNMAAKTGTAQGKNFNTIWTTGGLIDENTPYSVTVCLNGVEKDTKSREAGKIMKDILFYMKEEMNNEF